MDGEFASSCSTQWQYKLHVISIENSGRHLRTCSLDFNDDLRQGDEVIISDLNIILLSSVSNFQDASHVRVGKLDGIHDEVLGDIEGYGGYMQKLFASKSVNVSGTITAGDEKGFSSTFYAGKIHRNAFLNSVSVDFQDNTQPSFLVINPTKVGSVYSIVNSCIFKGQTSDWLTDNIGKQYSFSFWALANNDCVLTILQNDTTVGSIEIANEKVGAWRRCSCTFKVNAPKNDGDDLIWTILLAGSLDDMSMYFTSPQLESGDMVTQYQATDDILNYTDEYGAWFSQGGIGGTIQNPLLQLNYDGEGSIGTRLKSFLLRLDGSGYLANKNIRWDANGRTTLSENVKISWESFDDDTKQEIAPKSVKINGNPSVIYTAIMDGTYQCDTEYVELIGDDINIPEDAVRRWSYYNGNTYIDFKEATTNKLLIGVEDACWNQEKSLMVKYEVTYNLKTYYDTITIQKTFQDGYVIKITSSQGEVFQNGKCSTILTAEVYYQGIRVSDDVIEKSMSFNWVKYTYPDLETPVEDWWREIIDENGEIVQTEINPESQSIKIYNTNTTRDKYRCFLSVENVFPYPSPMIL